MGLKEQLQKDNVKYLPETNEDTEIADSEFWGFERVANRRAVMLDIRLKGGKFVSLPYSYMTKMKYDPSDALELHISGNIVKIRGRNMGRLYDYLCRHRVLFIQENLTGNDNTPEEKTYISSIDISENVE